MFLMNTLLSCHIENVIAIPCVSQLSCITYYVKVINILKQNVWVLK